jgi:hypothetical protein
MGMATTNVFERTLASQGLLVGVQPHFQHHEAVENGGVLCAVPALIAQGLFTHSQVYAPFDSGYYGQSSIVFTLAIMALCRISNPEQLKKHRSGEMGALLGLDRVPEMKCLREKIKLLADQNQAKQWNDLLLEQWLQPEADQEDFFFYVDGHLRVYHGQKANLPNKYVSRSKLCLNATTEYWVNDATGLPYLVVTGELTEKLEEVIKESIIVQLMENPTIQQRQKDQCPVLFVLVFDREAYHPSFFNWLWTAHKIAVITYRKNVKDKWPETEFKSTDCQVINNIVTMQLCEKPVELDSHTFREVRKLNESGHQTAIITTHPTLLIHLIAGYMFSRWSQENFFRYLVLDFDFDKMWQYGTQELADTKKIVNPDYRAVSNQIKKIREKLTRLKAKLVNEIDQIINATIDKIPQYTIKQVKIIEQIEAVKAQENILVEKREATAPKIKLAEMPAEKRYNQLKPEHKYFINIIKMISYRAETSLLQTLKPFTNAVNHEERMILKQLFTTPADIIPDYPNKTLTVKIKGLAANRYNQAIAKLLEELNNTKTIYPQTNLQLVYKI